MTQGRTNVLSRSKLSELLKEAGVSACAVFVTPETGSTNDDLKEFAMQVDPPFPALLAADVQTKGRGRQGKTFLSPTGGLYFSCLFPASRPVGELIGATCCAAVAVCRAVEKLNLGEPKIKWVNDIMAGDGKAAGILCESVGDGELTKALVIGIGINLCTAPEIGDSEIPAACFGSPDHPVDAERLCAAIAKELFDFSETDFSFPPLADEYRAHSMILGKRIRFVKNGEPYEGTVKKIDSKGELHVRVGKSMIRISSGEISIRPAKTV